MMVKTIYLKSLFLFEVDKCDITKHALYGL